MQNRSMVMADSLSPGKPLARFLLATVLAFAGCITASEMLAQDAPAAVPAVTSSELKTGDKVSVNVFDEDSLSGIFAVGPEGGIVFPLLGVIPASGHTTQDLALDIERRLEARYIRDAQVAVALAEKSELPDQSVTVIGQVADPGKVTYKAGTSLDLFTALASAGGLNDRGNRNRIELKRPTGDDLETKVLSLDRDRVFKMKNGDTLVVFALEAERTSTSEEAVVTVTVIGEVRNPGTIKMNPKSPLDIIGAIASAGGFTDAARPSKVVVRRMINGAIKTFEVNVGRMQKDQTAPFMLAPGDTISVPESLF